MTKRSDPDVSEAYLAAGRGLPDGDLKTLIVDDEPGNLAFAAEALHSFVPGFEVATALDVEQAFAWLDSFQPDLLLVDRKFVREGGAALLHKARLGGREVHVLVMTNAASAQAAIADRCLGADGILVKPLRLAPLLDTVRRCLRRRAGD